MMIQNTVIWKITFIDSWIILRLLDELFAHRFTVLRRTIELVRQGMKLNSIYFIPVTIYEVSESMLSHQASKIQDFFELCSI